MLLIFWITFRIFTWMMHAFKTSQFKVKAIFNNLIPITLSEKEIITSSIEPPSPIQHLRRGAPFFNLPRGAKTPSSVCTPGVCHPGYATVNLFSQQTTTSTDNNRQQWTKWSLCVFPAKTGDTKMTWLLLKTNLLLSISLHCYTMALFFLNKSTHGLDFLMKLNFNMELISPKSLYFVQNIIC